MPAKVILFDATLFVNAYETNVFRTGLYRVSEQLLKQLLTLTDFPIWLYDTQGRDRILRQVVIPQYKGTHLLTQQKKAYACLTDGALRQADRWREREKHTAHALVRAGARFLKNVAVLYSRCVGRMIGTQPLRLPEGELHYLATYYAIPDWVHQQHIPATLIVHDLIPIAHPEWFPNQINQSLLQGIINSAHECDRIVCVSESTRQDLLQARPDFDAQRVSVAHLAAAELFRPTPLTETVRAKYGLRKGYLLSVCTIEPRKNLATTLQAYERLLEQKSDAPQLVLAGAMGWKSGTVQAHIQRLQQQYPQQVIVTGYLFDNELAQLYTGAAMFLYPSLYEGFGLPLLEAMQCGCPVIVSNVSSLPEVVGEAGIQVTPTDTDALLNAIQVLLCADRTEWQQRALQQASTFSWQRMAQQVIDTLTV